MGLTDQNNRCPSSPMSLVTHYGTDWPEQQVSQLTHVITDTLWDWLHRTTGWSFYLLEKGWPWSLTKPVLIHLVPSKAQTALRCTAIWRPLTLSVPNSERMINLHIKEKSLPLPTSKSGKHIFKKHAFRYLSNCTTISKKTGSTHTVPDKIFSPVALEGWTLNIT